jgi:hypothetical protein
MRHARPVVADRAAANPDLSVRRRKEHACQKRLNKHEAFGRGEKPERLISKKTEPRRGMINDHH